MNYLVQIRRQRIDTVWIEIPAVAKQEYAIKGALTEATVNALGLDWSLESETIEAYGVIATDIKPRREPSDPEWGGI